MWDLKCSQGWLFGIDFGEDVYFSCLAPITQRAAGSIICSWSSWGPSDYEDYYIVGCDAL